MVRKSTKTEKETTWVQTLHRLKRKTRETFFKEEEEEEDTGEPGRLIPHALLQNLFDKLGLGLLQIHGQTVRPSQTTKQPHRQRTTKPTNGCSVFCPSLTSHPSSIETGSCSNGEKTS